jgi:hypothetical protein
VKLGGKAKPEGNKFDFKIKIIRTDLASREYLRSLGISFGAAVEPAIYNNSSYISKLWFINSYPGGILAKENIEDMPESYRRFVSFGNQSELQMGKNIRKEMAVRSNREQIGQNLFYSRPSIQISPPKQKSESRETAEKYAEIAENAEELASCESFREFIEDVLYGEGDPGGGRQEGESAGDEYDEYENDEEIRDILMINNVCESEMYKMSKVEYGFEAPGYISLAKDGQFEIKYRETETAETDGSYVRILFNEKNRGIVTFHKKDFFDDWFTLEKGKRISVDHGGSAYGATTVFSTKKLANTMSLEGGELCASYATEINGIPAETVSYSIKATILN